MSIREWEDEIRYQTHETAIVFDSRRVIILRKDGEKYKITFTDDEMALMQGATFTHNHPRGLEFSEVDPRSFGNSFSGQDLRLACYAQLAELRVVTPRLRFSLKPPATGWSLSYWVAVMEPVYLRHKANVSRELREAFASGNMTLAQADAAHFHEICSRVAYDLGLEYTREEG